jgi:DNA repair protein RadC
MTLTSSFPKPSSVANGYSSDENSVAIKHPAIRDFPSGERPRERLASYGAGHLSNSELLAILLRTGLEGENVLVMASRLLAEFGGLSGLSRIKFDEMCDLRGISTAKACQILAGIELGRRVASLTPEDRVTITSPSDLATLFLAEMSSLDREHLRVATLSTRNQVLGIEDLYSGSVNAALIRPAEVFATAVRRNAPQIAIVHNHPSGDPTPSSEDVAITKTLVDAGKLLDIEVVDHIVIGQGKYVSMRVKKLGFT